MIIDDYLLDEVLKEAEESPRLRMNRNLHDSLEAGCQRMLNALLPGTALPIHRHRHTAETYSLLRGHIVVRFHDNNGEVMEEFDLNPRDGRYGVHIPKGCWHSLEVAEPSEILEVKDGPYMPISPEDILA